MSLLAKTGLDSLKIGGHKVPIGLLAAGVGLAGVIVVLRARQQGQQVAQVGQGPATAAASGFGLPLPATDPGAQLANISAQLTSLGQGINGPSASVATPATVTLKGGAGLFATPNFDLSQMVTWNPNQTQLRSAGAPVAGGLWGDPGQQSSYWQPVDYLGKTLYAWAPFAQVGQGING